MPIYEYVCNSCGRTSSFLLLRVSGDIEPHCKHCASKDVSRILSRVAVLKGEERRMESLLDPSKFSDVDEKDPGSVERMMRRMGRELGDDLGGDFEESMGEAFSGDEPIPGEEL
jgi:putative FmdB family regulatory protein